MIDWKRKLSSRKFWAAIVGFVTAILTAYNINQMTIEQVTAIITGGGCLIAYILAEGYVDANKPVEQLPIIENDKLDEKLPTDGDDMDGR